MPLPSTINDTESQTSTYSPMPARRKCYPLFRSTNNLKFGIKICAVAALVLFVLNLSATVWVAAHHKTHAGRQILFEGDCHTAAKLNTVIHIIINALSTILLSASNFCMQYLSAPTRKEVDRAHANGLRLDIGILSPRNLRRIAKKRLILWGVLGASSLPLHLL